jgi:hypothetical protein
LSFYTQLDLAFTDLLRALSMPKILLMMILVVSTSARATLGNLQATQGSTGALVGDPSASALDSSAPAFQDQSIGPRVLMPVTGGAPVIGIPLGGDLFLPVTGGAPVTGIPLSP